MAHRVTSLALFLCVACAPTTSSPTPFPSHDTDLAFRNVSVVDVSGGRVQSDQTVIVRGDRIVAVGRSADVPVPAGAAIIDGTGRYLIPGLWDMHTHLNGSTSDSTSLLPTYVANGVTSIRDLWSDPPEVWDDSASGITLLQSMQRMRDHVRSGRLIGPRLVLSTAPLDGPFGPDGGTHVVRTPEQARALVTRGAADGVDLVGIYRWLAPDLYLAAADAARERGLPLAGGVPIAATFEEAAAAGHRMRDGVLEWELACSTVGDSARAVLRNAAQRDVRATAADSARSMYRTFRAVRPRLRETFDAGLCATMARAAAREGIWQMPRLIYGKPTVSGGRHTATAAPYLLPDERAAWTARTAQIARDSAGSFAVQAAHEREIFRILHAAGIPFVVGTESYFGSPAAWGFSVHDELVELVGMGLSPADALRAGTLEPARAMAMDDTLGTVTEGKLADLVLLDGNPLDDITNVRRIRAVVVNGRLLDRRALDELLDGVARAVADAAVREP